MKKVALSIINPVSYLVCSGAKWVENRNWKTDYRGRIYIHSSGQKGFAVLSRDNFPERIIKDCAEIQKELGNNPSESDIDIAIEKYGADRWNDAMLYAESCEKMDALYNRYYGSEWRSLINDKPSFKNLVKDKGFCLKNYAIIGHVDLVNIVDDTTSLWADNSLYYWIFDNPVLYEKPVINVKGKLRLFDVSHIDMPDD